MSYKIPELMDIMQQRAQLHVEPFDLTQRVIFDMDYAQVGAELLKRWNLPAELQNVIRYQVAPQNAPAQQIDAAILHLANHYAAATGLPSVGLETAENVNPFVWKITGLTHDDVMLALDEARKEYDVSVGHFMPVQKMAKRA
jgi:HD-like signal output (HDOD) protein